MLCGIQNNFLMKKTISMIYLIGGSPRCGKTILAKKIARSKKISWITTDAIYPIILNSLPKTQVKSKFPQTAMKTPSDKFRFDIYSYKAMNQAQWIEAKTMWPGTKALIEHIIYREQDYIIEGVHLLPRFINKLKNTGYWKNIRVVYLVKRDLNKIIKDFPKNKNEPDWMFPAIKGDELRIKKAGKMVQTKSEYLYKEARKYNFKVFNTDTNFVQKLRDAQNYLLR